MNITHLFALIYPRLSGPPAMRTFEREPYKAVIAVRRERGLFDSAPYWEASVRRADRSGGTPLGKWSALDFHHSLNLAAMALDDVGEGATQRRSTRLALRIIRRCNAWELRLFHPDPRCAFDRTSPIIIPPEPNPPPDSEPKRPADPVAQLVAAAACAARTMELLLGAEDELIGAWLPELQFRDVGSSVYVAGGKIAGFQRPGDQCALPPHWAKIGRATKHGGDGWVGVYVDQRSTRQILRHLLGMLQEALAAMPRAV